MLTIFGGDDDQYFQLRREGEKLQTFELCKEQEVEFSGEGKET